VVSTRSRGRPLDRLDHRLARLDQRWRDQPVSAGAATGLGGLELVNPQVSEAGWRYTGVPASTPRPLPTAYRPLHVHVAGAGRMSTLDRWREDTATTSLLALAGDAVRYEWYAEGLGPADLFLGASMTKSALAHLVGSAVAAGDLRVGDRVVDHVPELAGSGYARCRVVDLLTMTSGVGWVEDHRDPDCAASRLLACFAGGGASSRDLLTQVAQAAPPGTRYEYCTADSQVLDWVRERATGAGFVDALTTLWRLLGCESDAVVATDADGVALAGGGLAATARDWGRLALLQLDGTVADAGGRRRLLSERWLRASAVPARPFLRPGRLPSTITTHAGFGYHWWPLDDEGRRLTADGSRGQFGFVDRDLGVVVVKTSRWAYADPLADRQCRDLCYLGLPVLARAASGTSGRLATDQT
jgi:CubicO group peptidase (beta-lactamase class C family)